MRTDEATAHVNSTMHRTSRPEPPSLRTIARECYTAASGDLKIALRRMSNQLLNDDTLFEALVVPLITAACDYELRTVQRIKRDATWHTRLPPNYSPNGNGHRVKNLADSNLLMMFPLPKGPILGKATKDDLLENVKFYMTQGTDMVQKGQWLSLIADKVPKGKTVAKVLTEKQLAQLKEQACS